MSTHPQFNAADPAWLAHRYDRPQNMLWYRHVPRAMHADGPFLTDALVGQTPEQRLMRAEGVEAARPQSGDVHFIFHSAFCASTLLTRALDAPGIAMGLSEPVLLNDIVGIRRRGELRPAEIAHLMDDALTVLGRRWAPSEGIVIKPSNILNTLAPLILTMRSETRAILLYTPLDHFLSSVARKGLWCRIWVRQLLEGLLVEGAVDLGFDAKDYFRLTDLQVAAVGWLVQHQLFARLTAQFGDRVRVLDSETLIAQPSDALYAAGQLFNLPLTHDAALAIGNGPVFNRHSKSGAQFDKHARATERTAAENAHSDELEKVTDWAHNVAQTAGISLSLPHRLM